MGIPETPVAALFATPDVAVAAALALRARVWLFPPPPPAYRVTPRSDQRGVEELASE